MHCLLDSGCTIYVVSKRILDQFRPALKDLLISETGIAHVADGSTTRTYGYIEIFGKLRHWRYDHRFLVADIREDVLVGIDFLEQYQATINFRTAELQIGRHRLSCQDEKGHPLASKSS